MPPPEPSPTPLVWFSESLLLNKRCWHAAMFAESLLDGEPPVPSSTPATVSVDTVKKKILLMCVIS